MTEPTRREAGERDEDWPFGTSLRDRRTGGGRVSAKQQTPAVPSDRVKPAPPPAPPPKRQTVLEYAFPHRCPTCGSRLPLPAADTPTPERLRAWARDLESRHNGADIPVDVHGEPEWASYLLDKIADALESTRTPEPE